MGQLNLSLTPQFTRNLDALMKAEGLRHKSEAIRYAVKVALAQSCKQRRADFQSWIGALATEDPASAKHDAALDSDDALWEKGHL